MTRAAADSFRRKVTVEWPAKQDKDARTLLVRTARNGHARIMTEQTQRSGIQPDWNAYANRPGNTNLESVVLPGPIVFSYRYHREIISEVMRELRLASPFVSGGYVRGHRLFINGVEYDALPTGLKAGDVIMVANVVPYARRIEIGKTKSGRPFVLQVPDRIYERVAKKINAKYKQVARATFGYTDLPGSYVTKAKLSPTYGVVGRGGVTQRKRRQKAGGKIRYPAINIEVI